MSLKKYHRKRDFKKTREPRGTKTRGKGAKDLIFVVQKHAASRLHYDFRLEYGGVLWSWAVPKGPSLNPEDKRLAVHVEDHPYDYKDFEGIIPQGEYGGGTVSVWDQGIWIPESNPDEAMRKESLKFQLKGKKLKGSWALFAMKGSSGQGGKNWLLVKERDAAASAKIDITKKDRSVLTGRSIEKIAAQADRVWRSKKNSSAKHSKPRAGGKIPKLPLQAKREALPHFIAPQLATLTKSVPSSGHWIHEIKFDGYRAILRIEKGQAKIFTRNGLDWTRRFSKIALAAAKLGLSQAILDGEIVKLKADGTSSFQELQNALSEGDQDGLYLYLFDVLHCDGYNLRPLPLQERRKILEAILPASHPQGPIRFSEGLPGKHEAIFQSACRHALEGIVSKRLDSPYESRRGMSWLKTKCIKQQEFIIVGFTEPGGGRKKFGALLLAVRDLKGNLQYCGMVGTGFSEESLKEIHAKLDPFRQKTPTLSLPRMAKVRRVHWVKPRLVAEVEFTEWTKENLLRHPSFQGLREDKTADEIQRERPVAPSQRANKTKEKAVSRKAAKQKLTSLDGEGDEVEGVTLSHPDKILFPEGKITKRELAEYYSSIAERMLPYLEARPLSLVRCPSGSGKKCFYQKHLSEKAPAGVGTVAIREKDGKKENYLMVEDASGLVSLAQMGVLEIHPWGARSEDIEHPDTMVFDLDPDPEVPWSRVVAGARMLKAFLQEFELKSFVKTTGGKGLHVVIPLSVKNTWDEVKGFSKAVAEAIAQHDPKHFTSVMSLAKRKGKIFLDYLRNNRGSTAVAPYSTRARPFAPIALPISWEELDLKMKSSQFTLKNIDQHLKRQKKDPWRDFFKTKQSLPKQF